MRKTGGLVAVVGPSGVGKDTLINGVSSAIPALHVVKRVITRKPGQTGEDYTPVGEADFRSAVANREFCLQWTAHGLSYGIPADVLTATENGQLYIANLSRSVLLQANTTFPDFVVIQLTATSLNLANRLAMRGRESERDIAARLARSTYPMPQGPRIHQVDNNGVLQDTVDEITGLLGELFDTDQRPGDVYTAVDFRQAAD